MKSLTENRRSLQWKNTSVPIPIPQIRLRMGDARRKLNQKTEAVSEYMRAADLLSQKGILE